MPWRDGTGPQGLGPLSGKGFGLCADTGASVSGRAFGPRNAGGYGMGRGMRRGYGAGYGAGYGFGCRGRGFGRGGWLPQGAWTVPPDTRQTLEERAAALEAELGEVRRRLAGMNDAPDNG